MEIEESQVEESQAEESQLDVYTNTVMYNTPSGRSNHYLSHRNGLTISSKFDASAPFTLASVVVTLNVTQYTKIEGQAYFTYYNNDKDPNKQFETFAGLYQYFKGKSPGALLRMSHNRSECNSMLVYMSGQNDSFSIQATKDIHGGDEIVVWVNVSSIPTLVLTGLAPAAIKRLRSPELQAKSARRKMNTSPVDVTGSGIIRTSIEVDKSKLDKRSIELTSPIAKIKPRVTNTPAKNQSPVRNEGAVNATFQASLDEEEEVEEYLSAPKSLYSSPELDSYRIKLYKSDKVVSPLADSSETQEGSPRRGDIGATRRQLFTPNRETPRDIINLVESKEEEEEEEVVDITSEKEWEIATGGLLRRKESPLDREVDVTITPTSKDLTPDSPEEEKYVFTFPSAIGDVGGRSNVSVISAGTVTYAGALTPTTSLATINRLDDTPIQLTPKPYQEMPMFDYSFHEAQYSDVSTGNTSTDEDTRINTPFTSPQQRKEEERLLRLELSSGEEVQDMPGQQTAMEVEEVGILPTPMPKSTRQQLLTNANELDMKLGGTGIPSKKASGPKVKSTVKKTSQKTRSKFTQMRINFATVSITKDVELTKDIINVSTGTIVVEEQMPTIPPPPEVSGKDIEVPQEIPPEIATEVSPKVMTETVPSYLSGLPFELSTSTIEQENTERASEINILTLLKNPNKLAPIRKSVRTPRTPIVIIDGTEALKKITVLRPMNTDAERSEARISIDYGDLKNSREALICRVSADDSKQMSGNGSYQPLRCSSIDLICLLLIRKYNMTPSSRFIDLGSGYGNVVLQVALRTHLQACHGVDIGLMGTSWVEGNKTIIPVDKILYYSSILTKQSISNHLPALKEDMDRVMFYFSRADKINIMDYTHIISFNTLWDMEDLLGVMEQILHPDSKMVVYGSTKKLETLQPRQSATNEEYIVQNEMINRANEQLTLIDKLTVKAHKSQYTMYFYVKSIHKHLYTPTSQEDVANLEKQLTELKNAIVGQNVYLSNSAYTTNQTEDTINVFMDMIISRRSPSKQSGSSEKEEEMEPSSRRKKSVYDVDYEDEYPDGECVLL